MLTQYTINWKFRLLCSLMLTIIVTGGLYYYFYLPEKQWEDNKNNKEAVKLMKNGNQFLNEWPSDKKLENTFTASLPKVPHSKYTASTRLNLVWLGGISTFLISYFLISDKLCQFLGNSIWTSFTSETPFKTANIPPTMDKLSHWVGIFAVSLMPIAT